jgi:intracellular septation protein
MSIKQTTAAPTGRKWVKPLTEFGPLVVFFGCYFLFGLLPATAALIAATLAALAVTLEDETFIKMKPTIVQVIFSLVLLGGLMAGKPLLKPLLGAAWQMDEAGWHKLTLRFAVFFAAMAGLNEAVWRTQTTDVWVTFKVFGILGLTVVFAASQIYLLQRHVLADDGTPGNEEK